MTGRLVFRRVGRGLVFVGQTPGPPRPVSRLRHYAWGLSAALGCDDQAAPPSTADALAFIAIVHTIGAALAVAAGIRWLSGQSRRAG